MEDTKKLYKIIVQTETITISAQTSNDVSWNEAAEIAQKDVLHGQNYRNFVALPVCTVEQWEGHNVNFCPRCGHNLAEYDDSVDNEFRSDCPNCYAELDITIYSGGDE